MKKTIIVCDDCGERIPSISGLWKIRLRGTDRNKNEKSYVGDLCHSCATGIFTRVTLHKGGR